MSTNPDESNDRQQLFNLILERERLAVKTVEAIGNRTLNLRAEIITSQSKGKVSSTQAAQWLIDLQTLSGTCLNKTFDVLSTEKDKTKLPALCGVVWSIFDDMRGELTRAVHQISCAPSSSGELSIAGTGNTPSRATWDNNDSSNALSIDPDLSKIAEDHRSKWTEFAKLREVWRSASRELQDASLAWNVSIPESKQKYAETFKEYRTAAEQLAQSLPDLRDPMTACLYASRTGAVSAIIYIYSGLDPRGELFLPPKADTKPATPSRPFWELEISKDRWLMDDLKSKAQKVSQARQLTSQIFTASGPFGNDNQAAHTASLTVAVTGCGKALDELAEDLEEIELRRKTFIDNVQAGKELGPVLDLQIRPDLLSQAERARVALRPYLDVAGSDIVQGLEELYNLDIASLGQCRSITPEGSTPAQS